MKRAAATLRLCLAALLMVATGDAAAETPLPGGAGQIARGISGFLLDRDASGIPEPVPPDQAFVLTAALTQPHTLGLRFEIHDCCYLYRDKLRFALTRTDGAQLAGGPELDKVRLPPGAAMTDAYFGQSRVYRDLLDLRLPLPDLPANAAFLLEVTYQGCSEEGVILCYEPLTRRILLRTVGERLILESAGAAPAS